MILDTLPLWHRYAAVHPRFARAFTFLEQVTAETAVGRHDIDGDAVHAMVQRYRTQPATGTGMPLEAHRRHIDIQLVVRGREVIHWAALADLTQVVTPYDEAKDAAVFAAAEGMVPVRLGASRFVILFPDDAHAPCCAWDEAEEVVKVVVKVRCEA